MILKPEYQPWHYMVASAFAKWANTWPIAPLRLSTHRWGYFYTCALAGRILENALYEGKITFLPIVRFSVPIFGTGSSTKRMIRYFGVIPAGVSFHRPQNAIEAFDLYVGVPRG